MKMKPKYLFGLMMFAALQVNADDVAQWEPVKLQTSKSQPENGNNQNDFIQVEMLGQIERLQQEIQELRGILEEKSHLIERMQRDQRERYLDLDRRISQLSGGGVGSNVSGGTSTNASTTTGAATLTTGASTAAGAAVDTASTTAGTSASTADASPTTTTTTTSSASSDEREDYLQAFGFIRAKQYPEAVEALRAFIGKYPNGDYAGNAHYWLGEVYIVLPDLEQAKQAFMLVLNRYPDHRKAPDATYKLGVVYDQLGQSEEARKYLNKVLNEKPTSVAARLAENYLRSLK